MNVLNALEWVYRRDPCGVLANPLWKTLPMLEGCTGSVQLDGQGQVRHVEAWEADSLHLYWDADSKWQPAVAETTWRSPGFAVLNSRYAGRLRLTPDHLIQRFFRLQLNRLGDVFALPEGYSFAPVSLPGEAGLVSQVIGRCYAHLHPDLDSVVRWMQQPVFDPSLWVWIVDRRTQQPAGLGIAELDRSHGEASLEWIQVLPEFRGRGLAKALVTRLLKQLAGVVGLVTVSGEADNPSDPEHLYRRCGFHGQDVWWVVRRLGG